MEIQTLTSWTTLSSMLTERGLRGLQRWTAGRFDHEASAAAQIEDMKLIRIFESVAGVTIGDQVANRAPGTICVRIADAFVDCARRLADDPAASASDVERVIIGEGNHRVLACKT